jgi:cell division control protein 7
MTSVLLSQHSSNPLELPSSDPIRQEYNRRVKETTGRDATCPDSDAIRESHKPQMREYWNHLGKLFPQMETPQTRPNNSGVAYVDLDSDSDEERIQDELEDRDEEGRVEDEEADEEADDADAHGETDEEATIQLKSPEEREEIEEEIEELEAAVPRLKKDYKIIDRLGTGTFSSVYKAIDLGSHKWDNTPWRGPHPPSHNQSVRENKVFVAVKKIYPTSNPERIRNEIAIMQDCRGCRHVSQLITAFRHEDQVLAIMPYHRNEDFRVCFTFTFTALI